MWKPDSLLTAKSVAVRRLEAGDDDLFAKMLDLFGLAFDDNHTYCANRPDADYVARLLDNPAFHCVGRNRRWPCGWRTRGL